MRAIATSPTTFRKWLALLALVFFGSCLFFLPKAYADGKKGVPTTQTPGPKAPPATKQAPPRKEVPPVAVKSPPSEARCVLVRKDTSPTPEPGLYLPEVRQNACGCCSVNVPSLYIQPSTPAVSSWSEHVVCY